MLAAHNPIGFQRRDSSVKPVVLYGEDCSLTSDADRMISYRQQEHSVVTPDGRLHLLYNRGSLNGTGLALTLASSTDLGHTWAQQFTLSSTDETCTADIFFESSPTATLYITYAATTGGIRFKRFTYSAGTWTALSTETVFNDSSYTALNPSMVKDGLGAIWCAFPTTKVSDGTKDIRLIRRGTGGTWTDTTMHLGSTDTNAQVRRSTRPVAIPSGIGILFTVVDAMYWMVHANSDPITTWTGPGTIMTGIGGTDPYSSHWSVARDSLGDLHMGLINAPDETDGGQLVYFKWAHGGGGWTARAIQPAFHSAYPQAAVLSDDSVIVAVNDQYAYLRYLKSVDHGLTFQHPYTLRHPEAVEGQYANPRAECPAGLASGSSLSEPLPVLLQHLDENLQYGRLMYFF